MKTTPFTVRGEIVFPYKPLRDLAFVFPVLPPEKMGKEQLIIIPEQFKKKYHDGVGVILSIGPGYMNRKGKFSPTPSELKSGMCVFFDIRVPWGMRIKDQDGKEHWVCLCGVSDIRGIAEEYE